MLGWGLCAPSLEEGVVYGLEMGPLSSLVATSYRLPIVTINLSLTGCSQCSDLSRTDGQTNRIGVAIGGSMQ